MLVIAYKKIIIRLLLITLGFFGTSALYRVTGAEDHFAQIESDSYCYLSMLLSHSSNDSCSSWNIKQRREYQGQWVARTYVFNKGLRWQIDISPRGGFGMEPENPDEVFALRVELTYPKRWRSELIDDFKITGGSAQWIDLNPVDGSSTVFEAYAPLTRELAAYLSSGEAIQIVAEEAERTSIVVFPMMLKSTSLALLEPQFVADKVSGVIDDGAVPQPVYDGYSLERRGDSFTLLSNAGLSNTGKKPLAHWQLKTVQRITQYSNGDKFQGAMRAGKQHGQGSYTWAGGGSYTGEWKNGQRTGKGTYTWPNGDRYEGVFVNGQRSGQGVLIWSNGDRYEGDFVNDKRTGKGVTTWTSGNVYRGDFLDGKRTGKGTLTRASGDEYRGDFVDGKRSGKGVLTWASGSEYSGDFVDDKRHGYGTYTSSSGRSSSREYYRGEWVKEPEPEVVQRKPARQKCGSYENPCEIPSDSGMDSFVKELARAADKAFGTNNYGGGSNAAQIQAENEARWRAEDRQLKRKLYDAKVASDRRKKERLDYNRHNGTCNKDLELDGSVKAWYYIRSSMVCGIKECDGRSNKSVETRVFVSNLVYARKFDHDNLVGAFFDQVRIQYKNKSNNPNGYLSNGFVCRGDARNALRKYRAERSDDDIYRVSLPEYP